MCTVTVCDSLPVKFALSSFAASFVDQTHPSSEGNALDIKSCNMYTQQLQKRIVQRYAKS